MTRKTTKTALRASSSGRPTLEDIAREVGVSAITVSRTLRHPDKVSEAVRERVHKVAAEMGYVSNRAASALASARSMNIVVLVPSITNAVFVETLSGIEKVLRPRGYQMLLGISHYSPQEEDALVRAYLAFDPDGMLLTGLDYPESTRRLLERVRVPIVHMMEMTARKDVSCVGFSQEAAAEALTRYLLDKGRRRIAFVASQLDSRTMARNRGYRDTLIRAGLYDLRRELLVPDASSVELGGVLLRRILQKAPDCDAVFFCNDDLAQGALFECLRQGIKVPEQLAVCGFNDLPASACTMPSLTTVATPRYEIGARSAQMLISMIENRATAHTSIDLGFELKPRESA